MAKIARAARPIVVAVVALLVLPAVTAGAATKPKGTPIVIGVIGSFTGPQASSSRQAQTVAPAWAKYVNDLGGINGHPVKVVLADDGGDPAKGQAAEKTLVDQDNVLAIVVSSDNEVAAFADDAVSKKVALVSGSANATDWYQKAGLFPTPTDVLSGLKGQAIVATQFGHAKKFADLYCAEIAACKQADPDPEGRDRRGRHRLHFDRHQRDRAELPGRVPRAEEPERRLRAAQLLDRRGREVRPGLPAAGLQPDLGFVRTGRGQPRSSR